MSSRKTAMDKTKPGPIGLTGTTEIRKWTDNSTTGTIYDIGW